MVEYTNTYFETYVKKADLKQQILMENPVPDYLERYAQTKKFEHGWQIWKNLVKECLCDGFSVKVVDVNGRCA